MDGRRRLRLERVARGAGGRAHAGQVSAGGHRLRGGLLGDAAAPRIQRRRARGVPQPRLDACQPALAVLGRLEIGDLLARARCGDAGHDTAGCAAIAPRP